MGHSDASIYLESWFDDLSVDWLFEVTGNGWTTDEIGIWWLQKLSIPATTTSTKGKSSLIDS